MEVLAPAGSPESLTAALRAGADAAYLGASQFSARAGAKNFSREDLRLAVEASHARGAKIYLAINTLLFEPELEAALELAQFACTLPVDAVLVQDMGLFRLLRERCPELRLHASTQTSVHTAAGARALFEAGFTRLVLARELSLAEIKEIHDACPIELEAFVHGALCMSVSGQCYFSAVLGSRSGNRGMCAQPCRLPFTAQGGTGHDLSLKDLSMIERIGDLADAGVVCAKIEGRLKRPEYVAGAARACRLAADGQPVPPELMRNLSAVFSRSGFTTGYPDSALGRGMFGVRSKEDVVGATGNVLSDLKKLYSSESEKFLVDFTLKIKYNKPTLLIACDREGHSVHVQGNIPEAAENRPVEEKRCAEQLSKTGGTIFRIGEISCEIDPGLSVPVSELNRLRREALETLERARAEREPVPFAALPLPEFPPHRAEGLRLRASFPGFELPDAAKNYDLVFVPCMGKPEKLSELLAAGFPVGVDLPRGLFGMENAVHKQLRAAKEAGVRHARAGTLDGVRIALEEGLTVHGGFSLNIANSSALEWYRRLGLADAELSFELTLTQIARIGGEFSRGLAVYGRLPLMLTRNCPAANSPKGCLHCNKALPELTDRRGIKFPVRCFGACSEVLNSVPLFLADRISEVRNADFGTLLFTDESPEEAAKIIETYRAALRGEPVARKESGFTRGLYSRGIE